MTGTKRAHAEEVAKEFADDIASGRARMSDVARANDVSVPLLSVVCRDLNIKRPNKRLFDYDLAWSMIRAGKSTADTARELGVKYGAVARIHKLPRDAEGRFMPEGIRKVNGNSRRDFVEQHRADFEEQGWPVREWAVRHSMSPATVYKHLRGIGIAYKPVRGGAGKRIDDALAVSMREQKLPIGAIAEHFGVTDGAVYAAMRRHNAALTTNAGVSA